MEIIWNELTSGLPDATQLVHVLIRLVAAAVLGAVIGIQREQAGKRRGSELISSSRWVPRSLSLRQQAAACRPMGFPESFRGSQPVSALSGPERF